MGTISMSLASVFLFWITLILTMMCFAIGLCKSIVETLEDFSLRNLLRTVALLVVVVGGFRLAVFALQNISYVELLDVIL